MIFFHLKYIVFGFFKPFSAPVSINQRRTAGQGRVSDAGLNNALTPRWKRGACKPPSCRHCQRGPTDTGQRDRRPAGREEPCWIQRRAGRGVLELSWVPLAFGGAALEPALGRRAFKWGGEGSPANSHGQGARRGRAGAVSSTQRGRGGFAGTNKDSLSASWMSLRPQPGAKAAGTESELFAEVFHQINGTVLCRSSPFTRSQPPGSCA